MDYLARAQELVSEELDTGHHRVIRYLTDQDKEDLKQEAALVMWQNEQAGEIKRELAAQSAVDAALSKLSDEFRGIRKIRGMIKKSRRGLLQQLEGRDAPVFAFKMIKDMLQVNERYAPRTGEFLKLRFVDEMSEEEALEAMHIPCGSGHHKNILRVIQLLRNSMGTVL